MIRARIELLAVLAVIALIVILGWYGAVTLAHLIVKVAG